MAETYDDALWGGFPETLLEFEERFATEELCREYVSRVAGTAGRAAICATAITSGRGAAARFTNAPHAAIRRA
jgi:hypothetical protein